MDLGRHTNSDDSDLTWQSFYRGLGRTVGAPPCREGAKWPVDRIPKGSTQTLAVSPTSCQLDHFTALVLQQQGEQSTFRKRQR